MYSDRTATCKKVDVLLCLRRERAVGSFGLRAGRCWETLGLPSRLNDLAHRGEPSMETAIHVDDIRVAGGAEDLACPRRASTRLATEHEARRLWVVRGDDFEEVLVRHETD